MNELTPIDLALLFIVFITLLILFIIWRKERRYEIKRAFIIVKDEIDYWRNYGNWFSK